MLVPSTGHVSLLQSQSHRACQCSRCRLVAWVSTEPMGKLTGVVVVAAAVARAAAVLAFSVLPALRDGLIVWSYRQQEGLWLLVCGCQVLLGPDLTV